MGKAKLASAPPRHGKQANRPRHNAPKEAEDSDAFDPMDTQDKSGDDKKDTDKDDADPSKTDDPADDSKFKTDDFYPAWDKFISAQPQRAKRVTRAVKLLEEEKQRVEQYQPDGLQVKENAAQSWEEAAAECRTKVLAIVAECKKLNQKYRDANFNLEAGDDCLRGLDGSWPDVCAYYPPPWVKRVEDIFEKPEFFIDGASPADIHQGYAGDCWFLSALMAITADPRLMEKLCVAKDETVGVYGFVFYRDGEWIHEVIDDKLYIRVGDDDDITIVRNWFDWENEGSVEYDEEKLKKLLQQGGESLYFSHCKSNETWVPLIEKAYAKAHGDYVAIEGGWPSEGIEDLTGGVATVISPDDIMDKDRFWREELREVNKQYLFNLSSGWRSKKGVVAGHAYGILDTFEDGDLKLVKIKNPWGKFEWSGDWGDGSSKWTPEMLKKLNHTFGDDGIFWMSLKDMFKHFPILYRVRLFDKEWMISQRWTCVNVPWTVDYLDTKFELTVTQPGPVVIVLQQPDERYFRGLNGRYSYALHFRVYKAGEAGHRYLVRSMRNSGGDNRYTRSVSAELPDVEAGKYFVIFKVTAIREDELRPEEAVVKYGTERKDKLLSVGRRFDYAQTKGNLRGMEKSDRRAKRTATFDKSKRDLKRTRKNNKARRARDRLRKKRREDAMTAQRKSIHERAAEKRKLKAKTDAVANTAATTATTGAAVSSDVPKAASSVSSSEATVLTPATSQGSSADKTVDQTTGDVAKLSLVDDATKSSATAGDSSKPSDSITAQDTAKPADQSTSQESAKPADSNVASVEAAKTGEGTTTKDTTQQSGTTAAPIAADQPVAPKPDEDAPWEDPPEQADELEDDDFEWDSDMNGSLNSDTSSRSSEAGQDIDIFADDPWSAHCVLGLRVYSKSDVKIEVKTATEGAEDDVEVV